VAYISRVKTEFGVKPAPSVASFSARCPNPIEPAILKVQLFDLMMTLPLTTHSLAL